MNLYYQKKPCLVKTCRFRFRKINRLPHFPFSQIINPRTNPAAGEGIERKPLAARRGEPHAAPGGISPLIELPKNTGRVGFPTCPDANPHFSPAG
jgi:hypothetical protein